MSFGFSLYIGNKSRVPSLVDCDNWLEFTELQQTIFESFDLPATDDAKSDAPHIAPHILRPDTTRAKSNVDRLSGWAAIDFDDGLTISDAEGLASNAGLSYLLHTTTKHTAEHHKFRILLPCSRGMTPAEHGPFWTGTHCYFGGKSDPSCKDASRIYVAPINWCYADNTTAIFKIVTSGQPLDVDQMIAMCPPKPATTLPSSVVYRNPSPVTTATTQSRVRPASKSLYLGQDLFNSPVITRPMIDDYLALSRGEHHVGLYKFMCRVAARALFMGYAITTDHLIDFAKQIDQQCVFKRDAGRWKRISQEAQRALEWANQN